MKKLSSLQIVYFALFTLSFALISFKLFNGYFLTETYQNGLCYRITYDFDYMKGEKQNDFYIKAFLPQNTERQEIKNSKNNSKSASFQEIKMGLNKIGLWNGTITEKKKKISYTFDAIVRPARFEIDQSLELKNIQQSKSIFVHPSSFIESNDIDIMVLAQKLKGFDNQLDHVLISIFNYVYEIPSQPSKQLMSAVETLKVNAASCNGKSRLFVALCRSLDIPARVVGGIILNEGRKKTSHLWAEVLIGNDWVPFDPLNGYYAYLPTNFLEIYKGDEFLVKRSADMLFDYNYQIQKIEQEISFAETFNMFTIAAKTGMSAQTLSLLLLLPFGSLIVAIFRNVVGLKTFGVFLPVLIAISFISTGLIFGVISFVAVLLLISLLHYPMIKWGILHVPKLVAMLAAVVFVMILILFAGVELDLVMVGGITFFPIVILTISAEKYARIVVEEGFVNATKILAQTLLVTLFCYLIVSSKMIFLIVMNFPEILLVTVLLSLMLGQWIGLRISEYKRFGWILS